MVDAVGMKIAKALFDHMAALTTDPVLPVAWQGVPFTPPSDADGPLPFLAVAFDPNGNERPFIASDAPHRFIGMFHVSVYWPSNQGVIAPLAVAGQVIKHFPADLRLIYEDVNLRIIKRGDDDTILVQEPRIHVPLTIEFEAYA